ncbi:MAG: BamA/TamA family outer membrane protein, partial [Planctomycetota bacterium]
ALYDTLLGSDDEWVGLGVVYDAYGRLDEERTNLGWRLRGRANTAITYGDTDQLPFTERFFLGGTSILRGFDFRGVGPIDDGFSEGGQTLLAASLDLFYPLIRSPIPGTLEERDVLRAGIFADVGVLGDDEFEADPDEVRASVGFTLGFVVPIPITLSFGFPIREEEEDLNRTFSLSFFI